MSTRPKIIIIGAGFAGLTLARSLNKKSFDVTLIDKHNYHQFQPLFYQVATAGLDASNIAFPLRKVFHNSPNVRIRVAEVKEILSAQNKIITDIGELFYDYLVIATGADTNYFGNEQLRQKSFPMKSIEEALMLRNKILSNFEEALICEEEEKETFLNIVVVGAGPTGVEVSGALSEMKRYVLPKDYPELDFHKMQVYLVEGSGKTLGTMSEIASKKSEDYLKRMGVNVIKNTFVKDYDGEIVTLSNNTTIKSKTVIWAAGIKGNILNGIPKEIITPAGRIQVDRYNRIEGSQNIFAIGDIAYMVTEKYPKAHPQLANVANNQAKNLGHNLQNMQKGKTLKMYEYKDLGSMATVGRNLAVVDLPFIRFQGFFAWLTWMFLHLMLILGTRNKFFTFLNWAWNYLTFDRSLRLIYRVLKR